jgi:hypothetical protein
MIGRWMVLLLSSRCLHSVMSLKVAFLAQFGIAFAKDTSVANNLEYVGGSNQWNVSFAREAHDWEVDGLASFFQVLAFSYS